ncbi:hypothetical protein WME99_43100 [Sorangium sp. So ce136]|uniref:hypothetical protein n=1 Tax=Sorangium sp. So ce136 TaxID=3133284 RepID=UPI003F0D34D3
MHTPGRSLLVPALLLTLAACANGTDNLLPGYEEQAGGGGSGGGAGGEGGDRGVSASSSSRASSSSSVSSVGAGGAEGESGSGAGSGEGGDAGGAAECDYSAPNTCAGADDLGEISGDNGGASVTLTETGTTSKWFNVFVVDKSNSPSYEHFTATLTSPPGMNFDLIVYEGDKDETDCFASGERALGTTDESFTTTWDDFPIVDDDRWFSLEVRHVEGTACGSEATWTLTVEGVQPPEP